MSRDHVFSMPSSSTLLLFLLALGLTSARPWHGPIETATYKGNDWSPRPTQVAVDTRDLFARDSLDIGLCGWFGGNLASPAACQAGSSCVHDTAHGFVGCCATSGPCTAGVYTTCVDQNSPSWGQDVGLVDSGVETCQSDSYCNLNTYEGGFKQYSCGSSGQAVTIDTTFAGQPASLLLQVVFTAVSFSPSSAAPSSTSTSSTGTSSTTSTGSPVVITFVSHPGVSTGAIVGGVVGGIAGLMLIVGGILWFLYRRQAKRVQQRAGSPSGNGPANAAFQRLAYSPDDFQQMTEREGNVPPIFAAASSNSQFGSPEPAAQSMNISSDIGDETVHREGEIEDFKQAFNDVSRHHPAETHREPEYSFTRMKQITQLYEELDPEDLFPGEDSESVPISYQPFQSPVSDHTYRVHSPGLYAHQETLAEHQFETPSSATSRNQRLGEESGPFGLIPLHSGGFAPAASNSSTSRGRRTNTTEQERQRERDQLLSGYQYEIISPESSPRRFNNSNTHSRDQLISHELDATPSPNISVKHAAPDESWRPKHVRQSSSLESELRAGPGVRRYTLTDEAPRAASKIVDGPRHSLGWKGPSSTKQPPRGGKSS